MLAAGLAVAAEPEQKKTPQPDMAILEYLAESVELDGELVGPMDMAEHEDQKTTNEQTSNKDDEPQKRPQEDDSHD